MLITLDDRSHQYYVVMPGNYREVLVLNLPPGSYKTDWVDPASGSVVSSVSLTHQGGNQTLAVPEHKVDIALRMKRTR